MANTFETKLTIESWDEKPYRELDDGTKFSRAEVTLSGPAAATFESLLYYRADGTSTYVSVMRLTGTIDGRDGTVVLRGDGTFDGTTARLGLTVVEGTGELTGITGTATSASTHADYPHMPFTLTYDLG
jgi:hypothetical protein